MHNFLLLISSIGILSSCATDIKQSRFPESTTPTQAVTIAQNSMNIAKKSNADLLASYDYARGKNALKDAQTQLPKKQESENVLEDAALAKAYFERSIKLSKQRNNNTETIISARSFAISAGALNDTILKNKLYEIDNNLRDDSDSFEKKLSPELAAKYQKKYLDIEVKAVQEQRLGVAQKALETLESESEADDLAPKTYSTAKKNILMSKNMIAKSPRNSQNYEKSVTSAIRSTILLNKVVYVIKENGDSTPEKAALKIVQQEKKLNNMNEDVIALEEILQRQQSTLGNQQIAIINQADQIAFQNTMDNVRKEFNKEEATVYQQGNKLIIRIKNINFSVGNSNIPDSSKTTLNKMSEIIKDLGTKDIEIQGHTDSTGTKVFNNDLSKDRALSVANFFKRSGVTTTITSNGYGSTKPLADNQTKNGRSLNRRVDVVITAL